MATWPLLHRGLQTGEVWHNFMGTFSGTKCIICENKKVKEYNKATKTTISVFLDNSLWHTTGTAR